MDALRQDPPGRGAVSQRARVRHLGEGGWSGPHYSVAYAIADSPTGPFHRAGKVLEQHPEVATGAGHHSVIPVPGSDTWYIVYHRRPLDRTSPHHRVVCIDEMHFNTDGTIRPVRITLEGVRARAPADFTEEGR